MALDEVQPRKFSFAPYVPLQATRLILGSLPGDQSLSAGAYYAHSRNVFWPVLAELAELALPETYPARLALLDRLGIALWDVCASAERRGSLDLRITAPRANAVAQLLAEQPQLQLIAFNGQAAFRLFRRLVLPHLPTEPQHDRRLVVLPSTSPAAASITYAAKLSAWRTALLDDVAGCER